MFTEPQFFQGETPEETTTEATADVTDTSQESDTEVDNVDTPSVEDSDKSEDDVLAGLSDEDANLIIDELLKQQEEDLKKIESETKEQEEFISLQEYAQEMDVIEDLVAKTEEEKSELAKSVEALQGQLNEFESVWDSVKKHELSGVVENIILGELDKIPKHFLKENWARIENNKQLFPLVEKVLNGEDVSIPGYLKEVLDSRKKTLGLSPKTAESEPKPNIQQKINPMDNVLKLSRYS